ncbi:LytR/AlgR family response regulator transcription factor [Massilia pseudoviolaceinigra]|uniref:LytR/AlgR family response regulator transcription factor n=1 Tax=Massilia pseudoviolaceinigra TaxID=3057165 RepID=UPI00279660E7|nr:response regulator [Massilia sp. CCM 9206]MDQ1918940.1 response regulator [Massilia sp. CCM 9206]
MRILIVDDERPARDRLRRLLAQEAGVEAIAEARDAVDAMQRIAAFAPDALFLDIQMPEVSGLELAASLPAPAPLIVFATAYDQYAVQAFDANAIDYLLKPYDQARLGRALQRLRERLLARSAQLLPPFAGEHALRQLLVTERGVTRVIRVDRIGWIETADNYVVLHTAGEQPLMRQTLAGLLDKLGPGFVRCHRRAAVQLAWIERVDTLDKGDCELVLRDGARVPCSRQYRAAVMALL